MHSYPFSFYGAAVYSCTSYNHLWCVCQDPGRNKYRRLLPFLREVKARRALRDNQLLPNPHKKWQIYGSLGVWRTHPRPVPVWPITLQSQKMADLREFGSLTTLTPHPGRCIPSRFSHKKWRNYGSLGVWATRKFPRAPGGPLGTYPQLIHRLLGEFGSLPNSPYVI